MRGLLIIFTILVIGCLSNPLQNDPYGEQNRPSSIEFAGNPEDISTDHKSLFVLSGGGQDQDDTMRLSRKALFSSKPTMSELYLIVKTYTNYTYNFFELYT
jgi:hypothetical protein